MKRIYLMSFLLIASMGAMANVVPAFTIEVLYAEHQHQNNQLEVTAKYHFNDTTIVNIQPNILLPDEWELQTINYEFGGEYAKGDEIEVVFTIVNNTNTLSFYPIEFFVEHHLNTSTEKVRALFMVYFTPYNTTEIIGEAALESQHRIWYAKSEIEPTRIYVDPNTIPVSDIPNNFTPEYEWQTNYRSVHVPGLAYSIPMMAVDTASIPDSLKNQANRGGDGCFLSKKFVGNIRGRILARFFNEKKQVYEALPLRGIEIEIIEVNNNWINITLGETSTDSDGYFAVWVDICRAFENNNVKLFVRVKGRNKYYEIWASKRNDFYFDVEKHDMPDVDWAYDNGNIKDLELGNILAYHEGIKAVHLAVLAYEYANTFSGITLDNNLIIKSGTKDTYFFPDGNCGIPVPYYSHLVVPFPAIRLSSGLVLSESTTWHEFGHYLMWQLQNKCWIDIKSGSFASHKIYANSNSRIAWTEGFANAFMTICDAHYNFLDGENRFDEDRNDFERRVVSNNLITNGYASEFYVATNLYDLWDGADKFRSAVIDTSYNDASSWSSNERDDISLTFEEICTIIKNGDPESLPENKGYIGDIQRFHELLIKELDCSPLLDKVNKCFYQNRIIREVNNLQLQINSDIIYLEKDSFYVGNAIPDSIRFNELGRYEYTHVQKENLVSINSTSLNYNLPYSANVQELNQHLTISNSGVLYVNSNLAPGIQLGNYSTTRPPIYQTASYELCNSKRFTLGSNAHMVIGDNSGNYYAEFRVKSGSSIYLNTNSNLRINNNSKLIIEAGAKLFIAEGVNVFLDGANATIENYGIIEVLNNATFTKTGTGYIKFINNNSQAFQLNVNAKFVYTGTGITDKVLEIENSQVEVTSYSGSEFTVNNAYIKFTNGKLVVKAPINLDGVRVAGSGYGLVASGNLPVTIENCEFEGATNGLELYYTSANGIAATIYNSTFKNATGIKAYGRAFNIDNCLFENFEFGIDYGIYAENFSENSSIQNCTINDAYEYAILLNGSSIPVVSCDNIIIGNSTDDYSISGISAVNCNVTLKCSEIYSKETAIYLGLNSVLDISNENTSTYGNNIISKVPGELNDLNPLIELVSATQLYMKNGYNILKKNVSNNGSPNPSSYFVSGGLTPTFQTIDATNNFWYASENADHDFPNSNGNVDIAIFKTTIDFDPIADFGEYNNECLISSRIFADPCEDPNNCPTDPYLLNNCTECNSVNINTKPINKYLKKIIKEMRRDTLNLYTTQQFLSLDSLLKVNFSGNKPKVDLIKDRALHLMLKQYNIIKKDPNYVSVKPIALQKLRTNLNNRLARAINKDDTARIVQVHLIKAHLFLSENMHTQAINQFDNALNYIEPSTKNYFAIQKQKCLVQIEDLIENNLIDDSTRVMMMKDCNSTNSTGSFSSARISNHKPENINIDEPIINIKPNPSTDYIFVEMKYFSSEKISIYLMDVAGRVLINTELPENQFRSNIENLQLDLSNYSKGIYLLKISNGEFSKVNKIILN